ncbi:quinone oxidoreductase [Phenylobacterium sp. LjRoot225]|uniref:quinone oxidoreductase family protein n=1 Tax=Phenylobacterium sp. LjRoot225 TaxID=3342285 RepID=UPI003ECCCC39
MRAIRFDRTGGPDVLELQDVPTPTPGPGEILIRHEAVGVNFIDTYHRSGLYPVPLPSGLGQEAAGVVEAVGDGVTRFKVGDRAAYAMGSPGSYADAKTLAEARAVHVPDGIDARTAAAVLLKGMTAEFLLRRAYPLKSGQSVLIHAAAGGVGQLLTQWAKAIGATVIATAGSAAKAEIARSLGADHVILYRDQDVAAEVRRFTDGEGVAVAYDAVGKDTFEGTLGSLARRGLFVSFGNASGSPPPVEALRLMRAGSLFFTRPTLADYVATTEELDASAAAVFDMVSSGRIRIAIGQTYPLAKAAKAHEALEGRHTNGATLLTLE